jgi:hypothetical protein
VRASAVTWYSAITSSNADWVLGDARLISSPTTMLENTAPGRNSNSLVRRLKICTPVTSVGSRSGVNWMRFQLPAIDSAMALANDVFPTPGTSSIRRWPSASMQHKASEMTSRLPRTTRSMLSSRARKLSAKRWASASWAGAVVLLTIVLLADILEKATVGATSSRYRARQRVSRREHAFSENLHICLHMKVSVAL